jgi:glucokinase
MKNYMVFDIGGTSIKYSVTTEAGKLLTHDRINIAKDIEEFFDGLVRVTNENKERYELQGIAISAPGAVDSDAGIIGGASALPYIHGPNFKKVLFERTGLTTEIENDANCAALGECWLGAARGEKDSAFVVCGTGIGGAIVKDNRIHKGIHKHGGEFGYCIVDIERNNGDYNYFSWSKVGSTVALARNIAIRKGVPIGDIDGYKSFELCKEGDSIALEEVDKYFTYMAIGIYNIQYTYDPEVIILGGAICEREDYIKSIENKITEIMNKGTDGKIKPIIRKCQFGNDANKIGALYNFLNRNK